jgi:hypothetical protein
MTVMPTTWHACRDAYSFTLYTDSQYPSFHVMKLGLLFCVSAVDQSCRSWRSWLISSRGCGRSGNCRCYHKSAAFLFWHSSSASKWKASENTETILFPPSVVRSQMYASDNLWTQNSTQECGAQYTKGHNLCCPPSSISTYDITRIYAKCFLTQQQLLGVYHPL